MERPVVDGGRSVGRFKEKLFAPAAGGEGYGQISPKHIDQSKPSSNTLRRIQFSISRTITNIVYLLLNPGASIISFSLNYSYLTSIGTLHTSF